MISLGGGLPSADYFPFEHIDFKVPTPPDFSPEATRKTGTVLHGGKHDIQEGKSHYGKYLHIFPCYQGVTDGFPADLEIALNYGQATGAAPLVRFVTEHTEVSVPCLVFVFTD